MQRWKQWPGKIPPAAGELEAIDDHDCLLRIGATSLEGLSMYLAMTGFEFEVQEPAELMERMRVLGERLRRASG
jgi:predicted DNA-binding transcriptional regulator YafY